MKVNELRNTNQSSIDQTNIDHKNLKRLKDHELNEKIKNLAAEERKLTKEILLHIAEVDKRKLFLKMAYPSLFEYLTKEIGYSAGAAHRRIDAARLMHKVPEISKAIENGNIHLSQISKVQKICRHIKKTSGKAVEVSMQKDILQKIENKTSDQTDLILAKEFQVEVKLTEKKIIQRDESVRIELTFTKEEMALIKTAQALLSNQTGGGLKDTLLLMAEKTVKSYQPKTKNYQSETKRYQTKQEGNKHNKDKKNEDTKNENIESKDKTTFTSTMEVSTNETKPTTETKNLKSVTPKLKKQILQRDQSCQFKDPKTNKVCGSKHFLEIDHIQPRHLRGPNTPQNLRVLCKNHNLFRYQTGL